jgi:hypothetical protein
MKRRNFTFFIIAIVSGATAKWIERPRSGLLLTAENASLIAGLKNLFVDVETAADVGEAYLRSFTGNDLPGHLLAGVGIDPQTPRALQSAEFHRQRQKDFQDGETVVLEGWLMARSELCACALLACSKRRRKFL